MIAEQRDVICKTIINYKRTYPTQNASEEAFFLLYCTIFELKLKYLKIPSFKNAISNAEEDLKSLLKISDWFLFFPYGTIGT